MPTRHAPPLPRRHPGTWRPTPAQRARRLAVAAAALGLAVVAGLAAPAVLAAVRTPGGER